MACNMGIREIRELTRQVDGLISDKEGELLYNLAKNCKGNGVIVEIGSFKGKSTIWLAKGSKAARNIKVYAIDPHTGEGEYSSQCGKTWTFDEFKKNLENAKVSDIVVPLVKMSEEAAKDLKEPVEFIFIDGGHEYKFVKLDFDLWFPKLVDHGIIAFHDTIGWLGPKQVVSDLAHKSKCIKNSGLIDSIWFAEKVRQNSLIDRIRNRYILLLGNIYEFAFARLHLPKPIKVMGKKVLRSVQ
jgi:predicted O-methyltransferase YrrM